MDSRDEVEPRHLSTGKCLCQFFEEQHLHGITQQEATQFNDQLSNVKTTTTNVISKQQQEVVNGDKKPLMYNNNNNNKIQLVIESVPAKVVPAKSSVTTRDNNSHEVRLDMSPLGREKNLGAEEESGQDMDLGSPISRSEDLIKKLRLYLALRTNELQALDGQFFSSIQNACRSLQESPVTHNMKHPYLLSRTGSFQSAKLGPGKLQMLEKCSHETNPLASIQLRPASLVSGSKGSRNVAQFNNSWTFSSN